MNDISCTLLIPHIVGSQITSDVSSLHVYNVSIINSIQEFDSSLLGVSNKLVIVGSIPNEEFAYISMYKSFMDLEIFIISSDMDLCRRFSRDYNCFNLNHVDISYEMLLSVFYEDKELYKKYKVNPKIIDRSTIEVAKEFSKSTNKELSRVSNDLLVMSELYDRQMNDLNEKDKEILDLKNQVLGLTRTSEYYLEENKNLIGKFTHYHNKLEDYNVMFMEDLYDTILLNDYMGHPRIIYFKEYTEFLHLESFIDTVVEMLYTQKKSSFKVVRLFDSSDLYRYKTLDKKYFKVNGTFLHSNPIVSDYVAVVGNYQKLFDVILRSPLEYLIVIDHKKFDDVVLLGEYLKMNLCRNYTSIEKLNLPYHNTICNNHEGILSWDTYPNYKNLVMNDATKISYLTSRPVMLKLYSLINDII